MSLCILSHKDISLKLNDSFIVKVKWDKDSEYELIPHCINFDPPGVKYKEETQNFGNNSFTFLIPDIEIEDVSFTFFDDTKNKISEFISKALSYNFDFNDDNWYYKCNNIFEIFVEVLDNNFTKVVYEYHYKYCKLTSYDTYTLSYEDDNMCNYKCQFSFMAHSEQQVNRPIDESKKKENEAPITPVDEAPLSSEEKQNSGMSESPEVPMAPDFGARTGGYRGGQQGPRTTGAPTTGGEAAAAAAAAARAAAEQREQEQKTKEIDAASNSEANNDRIDELAYQMMRGTYDNGKPRLKNAYDAGYTEEERYAAQQIVNERDWQGLKNRHDERELAKKNGASKAEEIAVASSTPNLDRGSEQTPPATNVTGGSNANDAYQQALTKAKQKNEAPAPAPAKQVAASETKPVKQQPIKGVTQTEKTSIEGGKPVKTTTRTFDLGQMSPEERWEYNKRVSDRETELLKTTEVKNDHDYRKLQRQAEADVQAQYFKKS